MRHVLSEWAWLWVGGPLVYAWFWVFFALGPAVPPGHALPPWWFAVVFLGGGGAFLGVCVGIALVRGRWRRRRLLREEFSDH